MNITLAQPPFFSVQGEGIYVGVPSVFVRLTHCTLDCKGFGQCHPKDPSTYKSNPVQHIDSLDQYETPKYGCDTSYAKDPEFEHLWTHTDTESLAKMCADLVEGSFTKNGSDIHLVITGGEPMLYQEAIAHLLTILYNKYDLRNCTIETNGTVPLKPYLVFTPVRIFMSVSPKLHCCSGVPNDKAIKPAVVQKYIRYFDGQLKFVCGKDPEVWKEMLTVLGEYGVQDGYNSSHNWTTVVMPVGSDMQQMEENATYVAEKCMHYGLRFTPRLHIYLWKNSYNT